MLDVAVAESDCWRSFRCQADSEITANDVVIGRNAGLPYWYMHDHLIINVGCDNKVQGIATIVCCLYRHAKWGCSDLLSYSVSSWLPLAPGALKSP